MMRYLNIPGEILSNRYFSPLEKMILALIWNIHKSGREIFFTTEWLELYYGTKKEIIEQKFNNLINCGVISTAGSKTICCFTLESIKNFSKQNITIPKGTVKENELWQSSKDTLETSAAKLVEIYSHEIKEAPT